MSTQILNYIVYMKDTVIGKYKKIETGERYMC